MGRLALDSELQVPSLNIRNTERADTCKMVDNKMLGQVVQLSQKDRDAGVSVFLPKYKWHSFDHFGVRSLLSTELDLLIITQVPVINALVLSNLGEYRRKLLLKLDSSGYISVADSISDLQVLCPLNTSDHNVIKLVVNLGCDVSQDFSSQPVEQLCYDFSNADYEAVKLLLMSVNWFHVFFRF